MWVSIESCRGGFVLDVRLEDQDPPHLAMNGQKYWKVVFTKYEQLESYLKELFTGK